MNLTLLTLFSALALAGDPVKAEELANKALVASDEGKVKKALKLSDKALKEDPNNATAHYVRARLALMAFTGAEGEDAAFLLGIALEELGACAASAPTSTCAGMYRDLMASLEQRPLVPHTTVSCSPEAEAAIDAAEQLFQAQRYEEAKPKYEEAIRLCPTQPAWMTWYGDVYFSLEDMDTAIAWYDRALVADPCHPPAHRFRSDALLRKNDLRGAYDGAVWAVACDPTYETGWSQLEGIVAGAHGVWIRPQVHKPELSAADGGETINLSVTPGDPFGGGIGVTYSLAKVGAQGSPLQVERAAVRSVLTMLGDSINAPDAPPELAFWRLMAAADGAGYLDEAIYVFLLDEALVPEFMEHRIVNRQRMFDFIRQFVAIIP